MTTRTLLALAGLLAMMTAVAGEPAAPAAAAQPAPTPTAAASAVPTINQATLLERIDQRDPSLFVLDVRRPDEYAAGHVPGAVNIPYDQIDRHLKEIPRNKDVVLYCHSGRRAGLAAATLEAHGYTRLLHLQGDMQAWVKDGRPVDAEAAAKPGS
jgi:phage shock protein E